MLAHMGADGDGILVAVLIALLVAGVVIALATRR